MPARLAYSLLWLVALPFVLLRLLWRARRQPGYLADIGQRFARFDGPAPHKTIWLHAVSVGETRAAEPLVRALRARWPDHSVILTQMTPTGRETAQALFGKDEGVRIVWLPYDLPFLAQRFFAHFRPRIGIVMETELWPNTLLAARAAGVPVLLANARLSERSARRYARWPSLSALTVRALDAIGAQTAGDAERLRSIGAHAVEITGNVKFDIEPPAAQLELGSVFRAGFGGRPTLLAASTRDGEEALILDAFTRQAPADTLLILVPRHPQRFDEVAALVEARGLKLVRRSRGDAITADTRVWLGDSMGEMFAYYAAANAALIGGSWLPFGGQNLIEACAVGTPVVVGPHTYNFLQVAEQAVECGAARRATDVAAGVQAALTLIADPAARERASQAGLAFTAAHRGATEHTLRMIETRTVKP
ncbi:MAG: lipid IV(A) 3-deoxy-D-manno-octulosonic acid transferase [Pseudazoarcus pumilus]|nr:lipid IV(A) 3-deoxy-D-manno-octulosonic acid transferase [Pseudazoarcus pumilus]